MLEKITNSVLVWVESFLDLLNISDSEVNYHCKKCQKRLSARIVQCPYCGSRSREITLSAKDSLKVIDVFFRIRLKRFGFNKFVYELVKRYLVSGNKHLPEGVFENRTIDKESELYDQTVYKIKDGKIGQILHKDKEKLSKHKN